MGFNSGFKGLNYLHKPRNFSFVLSSLVCLLSTISCGHGGLLWQLIALNDTYKTHTTLGMTPLDEGLARHGDLYLTTHKTHKREILVPLAEFEPAVPASERPQPTP